MGQAHRGDDGIQSEDEVYDHDDGDDTEKGSGIGVLRPFVTAFHLLVDLGCAFPQQENSAEDEDHVAPGQGEVAIADDGSLELGEPHQHREHGHAQQQRTRQTDALCPGAVLLRQALGSDGEENQIVDAEDDLEK